MQLTRFIRFIVFALVLALTPHAAKAQCVLALTLGGTLALSADAAVLGSSEPGGAAATITIVSVGANTISLSAPQRTLNPAAYNASGEVLELAYAGLGGLAGVSRGYAPGGGSFGVSGLVSPTILNIHNRIVNPNGFAAGSYATRTVVTCN